MSANDNTKPPGEPPGEFELTEEEMPPAPVGAPFDLRDRLVLALKTTDPTVLAAAEAGYRGEFANTHDFICQLIAETLPPHLQWLLSCINPDALREGYENGMLAVWAIPIAEGRALIFEAPRAGIGPYQVPAGNGAYLTVYQGGA